MTVRRLLEGYFELEAEDVPWQEEEQTEDSMWKYQWEERQKQLKSIAAFIKGRLLNQGGSENDVFDAPLNDPDAYDQDQYLRWREGNDEFTLQWNGDKGALEYIKNDEWDKDIIDKESLSVALSESLMFEWDELNGLWQALTGEQPTHEAPIGTMGSDCESATGSALTLAIKGYNAPRLKQSLLDMDYAKVELVLTDQNQNDVYCSLSKALLYLAKAEDCMNQEKPTEEDPKPTEQPEIDLCSAYIDAWGIDKLNFVPDSVKTLKLGEKTGIDLIKPSKFGEPIRWFAKHLFEGKHGIEASLFNKDHFEIKGWWKNIIVDPEKVGDSIFVHFMKGKCWVNVGNSMIGEIKYEKDGKKRNQEQIKA